MLSLRNQIIFQQGIEVMKIINGAAESHIIPFFGGFCFYKNFNYTMKGVAARKCQNINHCCTVDIEDENTNYHVTG